MEDDYGTGYAAGKAKALFECAIAVGHMSATPECRCSPCVGLRHAMYTMSEATPGPTSTPEPKRGLCVGCGCDGMLVNSACPKCWA